MSYQLFQIDVPGTATCTVCSVLLTYGNKGIKSITNHLSTAKHVKNVVAKLMTTLLPGASNPDADGTYGIAPVYSDGDSVPKPSQVPTAVHILDRVANMEAMLISFLAERNLSFTDASKMKY